MVHFIYRLNVFGNRQARQELRESGNRGQQPQQRPQMQGGMPRGGMQGGGGMPRGGGMPGGGGMPRGGRG